MADDGAEADVLGRLEAALDRIAAHVPPGPVPATGLIAARLDRLIGQLQDALADDTEAAA